MSIISENRVVGIVVQTIPFQDHHQILSLYSAEWGLIRIIIKYAYAKKSPCFVEPLNLVEICLKKSKSDLFQAVSVSRLNTYANLRSSYSVLSTSLDLLSSIVKSQVYHKPSPILFSLLLKYLEYIPQAKSPKNLSISFKLKILRHDGWLAVVAKCSSCEQLLSDVRISQGQFFCSQHELPYSLPFSLPEMEQFKLLTLGRSFDQIDCDSLISGLEEKVHSLFAEFIA